MPKRQWPTETFATLPWIYFRKTKNRPKPVTNGPTRRFLVRALKTPRANFRGEERVFVLAHGPIKWLLLFSTHSFEMYLPASPGPSSEIYSLAPNSAFVKMLFYTERVHPIRTPSVTNKKTPLSQGLFGLFTRFRFAVFAFQIGLPHHELGTIRQRDLRIVLPFGLPL